MLIIPGSAQVACRLAPGSRHCLTSTRTQVRVSRSLTISPSALRRDAVDTVVKFYTEGWGSDTSVLDTLLSEDHVQIDRVWGAGPKEGRKRMKAGVAIFRRFYPDVRFSVSDVAITDHPDKVFVSWSMTGTFEGVEDTSYGMALMTMNEQGQIAQSEVFRQATRAEVVSAQRSERGLVLQAAVMEKKNI